MMRLVSLLSLLLLVGACSSETAPLTVTDVAIARPKPGMQMTAGYFTLTNHTSETLKITKVTSPQFGSVEMHESVVEDGMARMYELGDLTLLPNQPLEFRPGGKHLMLMRPVEELDMVTLEFHSGDAIVLSVNATVTD
jgi:copper(I)-binding protein